jgi:hypothetical protein
MLTMTSTNDGARPEIENSLSEYNRAKITKALLAVNAEADEELALAQFDQWIASCSMELSAQAEARAEQKDLKAAAHAAAVIGRHVKPGWDKWYALTPKQRELLKWISGQLSAENLDVVKNVADQCRRAHTLLEEVKAVRYGRPGDPVLEKWLPDLLRIIETHCQRLAVLSTKRADGEWRTGDLRAEMSICEAVVATLRVPCNFRRLFYLMKEARKELHQPLSSRSSGGRDSGGVAYTDGPL